MNYKKIDDFLRDQEPTEVIKAILRLESNIMNDKFIEDLFEKVYNDKSYSTLFDDRIAEKINEYYNNEWL